MTTEQREWTRLLAWEGCLNARDLGGYATARRARDALGDGGALRQPGGADRGRAGRPGRLRGAGDRRPAAAGRAGRRPQPVRRAGRPRHRLHQRLLHRPGGRARPTPSAPWPRTTSRMLDRYRQGVAEAMAAIARAPEGAVLIHCAAGKDRTGLISALLLGLVDVPGRDDRRRLRDDGRAAAAPGAGVAGSASRPRSGPSARPWWPGTPPPPRSWRRCWRGWPSATAGSSRTCRSTGLGQDDLERLRDRLVAPAGGPR